MGRQSAHVGVSLFFAELRVSCGLEASSSIQFYHLVCLHPLFFHCARKSLFWSLEPSGFFSDLNISREQHVFCYFYMGRELGAGPRGVKSHRGWSGYGHQDRQFVWRALFFLALSSPSSSLACHPSPSPAATPSVWRNGPTQHLVPRPGHGGSQPDSSKKAVGVESSDDEFGILDERCIDTGVFQERHFLQELVVACSHPAAAATNQLRYPDSSRLVRRTDSSVIGTFGSGRARDLVRSVVARVGCVSRLCQGSKSC